MKYEQLKKDEVKTVHQNQIVIKSQEEKNNDSLF